MFFILLGRLYRLLDGIYFFSTPKVLNLMHSMTRVIVNHNMEDFVIAETAGLVVVTYFYVSAPPTGTNYIITSAACTRISIFNDVGKHLPDFCCH